MTAFTTNTTSDLTLRKRQMPKAPSPARTAIQRLAELITAVWTKPS